MSRRASPKRPSIPSGVPIYHPTRAWIDRGAIAGTLGVGPRPTGVAIADGGYLNGRARGSSFPLLAPAKHANANLKLLSRHLLVQMPCSQPRSSSVFGQCVLSATSNLNVRLDCAHQKCSNHRDLVLELLCHDPHTGDALSFG